MTSEKVLHHQECSKFDSQSIGKHFRGIRTLLEASVTIFSKFLIIWSFELTSWAIFRDRNPIFKKLHSPHQMSDEFYFSFKRKVKHMGHWENCLKPT